VTADRITRDLAKQLGFRMARYTQHPAVRLSRGGIAYRFHGDKHCTCETQISQAYAFLLGWRERQAAQR
jgi:hypothetical protein